MIKPGDTCKITKDSVEGIKRLIKQTDGLRLSEKQIKELHDCFDCEDCICEEYCKEQDKLDFPEIGGKNMT